MLKFIRKENVYVNNTGIYSHATCHATCWLQSPVLQLTKDDSMFQSEWCCDRTPPELFPGPAWLSTALHSRVCFSSWV